MFRRQRALPRAQWPTEADCPGSDLLDYLIESDQATATEDGAHLPHACVAALTEDRAARLNLPPAIPHALQVRSLGRLDQPDFSLGLRWMRFGQLPVMITRTGALATEGNRRFRVPAGLLRVVEAVEAFQQADTADHDDRIGAWMPVQEALSQATGDQIAADGYLADLRLFHAASFSLSVDMTADRGVWFDPVLFGRASVSQPAPEGFDEDELADPVTAEEAGESLPGRDTLVDEADALLTPAQQRVFLRDRWERYAETRAGYVVARNTYVMLDPALRTALDTVRRVRAGSDAERRAFLKTPRAALADALDQDADSPALSALFVETQQFADRVTGIGLWQPKVLPWLPRQATSWLPERIGFLIDGRSVEIAPEHVPTARAACEAALSRGDATFAAEGVSEALPATAEALDSLKSLESVAGKMVDARAAPTESSPDQDGDTADPEAPTENVPRQQGRIALEQNDNLEDLTYRADPHKRETSLPAVPPSDLMAPDRLFPHQDEGFRWMVRSWTEGHPGILLADDMGLGKTIQTLAFMAWLHTHLAAQPGRRRGPFLIVAPTALLKNWRAEHDRHLLNGGLGPLAELYGGGVAPFRIADARGRDTEVGHAVLCRDRLEHESLILTTYETLANYHISLAGIHFPLVVFDEIQKIKTPTTINTHAAKTLNGDFVIGLTGTPVENRLSDLWSIMDRLHPGLLGDLKSFIGRYRPDQEADLRMLHDTLTAAHPKPQVMLRRMKDATDLGKALPERTYQALSFDMPAVQAEAYTNIVVGARQDQAAGANRGAMLKVLHGMRSVSLHPEHPDAVVGQPSQYDSYITASARLMAAMETLDHIHAAREKALVFIEFRAMQNLMAEILRHRYALPGRPAIINGATPSARRQNMVEEFQADPPGRFNVMILSPRAAGVGLTITAANHVLHLSRWWNPAVEDQCNDRAYRIGQDKPVTVYTPIARHPEFGDASFDVTLDLLLARKRRLSRDLLIPGESPQDYQDLFDRTVESADPVG